MPGHGEEVQYDHGDRLLLPLPLPLQKQGQKRQLLRSHLFFQNSNQVNQ